MADIVSLAKKLRQAAAGERGVGLSAEEVDLVMAVGANDVIQRAADEKLRSLCVRRNANRNSIDGDDSPSPGTGDQTEASDPPTLPPSGMTQSDDELEAFQRAQRTLRLASGG